MFKLPYFGRFMMLTFRAFKIVAGSVLWYSGAYGLMSIPIAGLHLAGLISLLTAQWILGLILVAGFVSATFGYTFSVKIVGHKATWDLMEIYLYSPERKRAMNEYMVNYLEV